MPDLYLIRERPGMVAIEAFRAERAVKPKRERTPVAVKAARLLGRYLPRWTSVRRTVAVLGGFGLVDAAAWQGPVWLGLAVTGISLFAADALSGE